MRLGAASRAGGGGEVEEGWTGEGGGGKKEEEGAGGGVAGEPFLTVRCFPAFVLGGFKRRGASLRGIFSGGVTERVTRPSGHGQFTL